MSILDMELGARSYRITVERGALAEIDKLAELDRRVLIVTDDGVPREYAEAVAQRCKCPSIVTLKQGESNKTIDTYSYILSEAVRAELDRGDCIVAVGGGVVGDMAGFAAATYMRGIDFYNVPTTLLSQIDSSIGGKVAVDFGGYKNLVGAFYQPRAVIIDPLVLNTLDSRQIACGMAEAIKIFATFDREMFSLLEREGKNAELDAVIIRALELKKAVVEQDEREKGLRRVLNFGHTVGHAIESLSGGALLHGECVAIGMLCMSEVRVRERIAAVTSAFGLPTGWRGSAAALEQTMLHDKKSSGDGIVAIWLREIADHYEIRTTARAIAEQAGEVLELI